MLVQTPSKIFKADFRTWNVVGDSAVSEILNEVEKSDRLKTINEVVINQDGIFERKFEGQKNIILFPLYGEILVNDFGKTISAGEIFNIKLSENQTINIKNNLTDEKADFLIFEFNEAISSNLYEIQEFSLELKNKAHTLIRNFEHPNYIGLFDGRKEGFYELMNKEKSIFAMVLNGAFEFQNRLMENRDALLIWDLEELEFEALSENALLFFMEI